ncbi:MAG: hypothetical protein HY763_15650 [Planctomycetes bacterium]|nr:hypothetical protein [Planctomycetota bacterium]
MLHRVGRFSPRAAERAGLTLLEVMLAIGVLALVTALAVPNFINELRREELPGSARQLRSLLSMTAAHAAFDGKRYRLRFPEDGEVDALGTDNQPIVEREDDAIREPEVFNPVTEPWAVGKTFHSDVWCAEVRIGRPTIERVRQLRAGVREPPDETLKEFDPYRPPLVIDPDATSDWATFVLTLAPRDIGVEEVENYPRVELILEGATGLAWVQRPFYDEELDLFEEKNWPAVLRQDFLRPDVLTEDDVLELREFKVRP